MSIRGHFRFPRQTKFYDPSSIMLNRPHVKENKVTAILWIKLYSWQTNKSNGTNHCCPFLAIQQLRYNERRIYLKRCDLLSLIYYYQLIRRISVCTYVKYCLVIYRVIVKRGMQQTSFESKLLSFSVCQKETYFNVGF